MLKTILLAALFVSLSACSPPAPVVIAAIGDSTMWGYSSTPTPGRVAITEPQALQTNLHGTAVVRNFGINMSTARELLEGGYLIPATFDQLLVKNQDARIVLINYGINDAFIGDIDAYRRAMTSLITKAQAAGKVVVLEEPNPSCLANRATLPQFVAVMDALAVEYKLALIPIYHIIMAQSDWKKNIPDCLHPTQQLYLLKAAEATRVVGPIVERLQSGAAQ